MLSGNPLAVQRLELRTFTAGGPGSIPGQGTKIPQAVRYGQKKKRIYYNSIFPSLQLFLASRSYTQKYPFVASHAPQFYLEGRSLYLYVSHKRLDESMNS